MGPENKSFDLGACWGLQDRGGPGGAVLRLEVKCVLHAPCIRHRYRFSRHMPHRAYFRSDRRKPVYYVRSTCARSRLRLPCASSWHGSMALSTSLSLSLSTASRTHGSSPTPTACLVLVVPFCFSISPRIEGTRRSHAWRLAFDCGILTNRGGTRASTGA